MKKFIDKNSILYKIWGTTDITLFIFAGASAEFALNKQVDWLFFTGKLPADPIGRLFSTVRYSQQIIFSQENIAKETISKINSIHDAVETARGQRIPPNAYKDVLFMLVHYSITAFELLERKLTTAEKDEIVYSFGRIGESMRLTGLPVTFDCWKVIYAERLSTDLEYSANSRNLFLQYKKHLGIFRFFLLKEVQKALVPQPVKKWLRYGSPFFLKMIVPFYRLTRSKGWNKKLILLLVPDRFHEEILRMDSLNTRAEYQKPTSIAMSLN